MTVWLITDLAGKVLGAYASEELARQAIVISGFRTYQLRLTKWEVQQ